MTPIAPSSRAIANRSQCWLIAGHDDARPDRVLAGRQTGFRDASGASSEPFGVALIDWRHARHAERCIDTNTLDQRRRQNRHSAR
jgi:hypothetical protein